MLFQAGKPIRGKRIRSTSITEAIKWSQEVIKAKHSAIPDLEIQDSVIEDHLVIAGEDQGSILQGSPHLQTEVYSLNDVESQFYRERGASAVVVVPIALAFKGVHFKDGARIENTLFRKPFRIERSIFERGGNTDGILIFRNNIAPDTHWTKTEFHAVAIIESNKFDSETEGTEFSSLTFKEVANFSDARFAGVQFFSNNSFEHDVSFNRTTFEGHSIIQECSFGGLVGFHAAKIKGNFLINSTIFQKAVYFSDLNKDNENATTNLQIAGSHFHGRVYFTNARLNKLTFVLVEDMFEDVSKSANEKGRAGENSNEPDQAELGAVGKQGVPSRIIVPTVLEKPVVFAGLECDVADFTEAEFRDYTDFSRARFAQFVDFSNVSFEEALNFQQTELPIWRRAGKTSADKTGLILDGVRFQKPFNLEWVQIDGRVDKNNTQAWRTLEGAFKNSSNLEGQNESMYRRRFNELGVHKGWAKFTNGFEFWYWGFGVRPLRPLGWFLVLVLVFTFIYWTQTRSLKRGMSRIRGVWQRLKFTFQFSLRTAWSIDFGLKNARTPLFKVLTLSQSVLSKVILISFLKAFSNTSPLLNDLIGKMIHL